jgi:uncharacterized RDD family membrane protein YckC
MTVSNIINMKGVEAMEHATCMASLSKRLGGAVLDAIIALLLVLMLMGILAALGWPVLSEAPPKSWNQDWVWVAVGALIYSLLNGYFLAYKGQSVGKMVVGTRIVDSNGNIPGLERSLGLRFIVMQVITHVPLVGFVIGLADPLFIFGKARRCLHDYLAGTWVIDIELSLQQEGSQDEIELSLPERVGNQPGQV